MGFGKWLGDRIRRWEERPADPSVLDGRRNPGSESMIDAESPEAASETARTVRRNHDRRRRRWGGGI